MRGKSTQIVVENSDSLLEKDATSDWKKLPVAQLRLNWVSFTRVYWQWKNDEVASHYNTESKGSKKS